MKNKTVIVPDFLLEMSEQMRTQDNRVTADPIWQVRCKREVTCCEGREDYTVVADCQNEYHEVYKSDDGDIDDAIEYMRDYYPEFVAEWESDNEADFDDFDIGDSFCDLPDAMERIPMQYVEEVVKTCLTEADAKWFIRRKQHDYPKLYTYVESMCYTPQMIELRNWILSLGADDENLN